MSRFEFPSDQKGESRTTAIGELNGRFFAIIYTMRGDVIRLITARRARTNEKRDYHARYPQDGQKGQD
ncbi:MAG: BrnT family toxin [Beijerinckiaceae bacterium]|nr:BrnT family toxin [Beijerinckiaceae bacterium]